MLPNSFAKRPSLLLAKRIGLLSLPVALIGFLAIGFLSTRESLMTNERLLGRNDVEIFSQTPSSLSRSFKFLGYWIHDGFHPPEGCSISEPSSSEFRQNQCQEFWGIYQSRTLVALLPLFGFLLGFSLIHAWVHGIYRRATQAVFRLQANSQRPQGLALVANPPGVESDFFAWICGFQKVAVQPPGKAQIAAYLPEDLAMPLPGEKMILFPLTESGGQTRRWGAFLHAPHMAIVSGVRT